MGQQIVLGGGSVVVGTSSALTGNGTVGTPLDVVVDGVTMTINGSNQLVSAGGSPPFALLTSDPSFTDDTFWAERTGTSPTQTVSIFARISGVTVPIAQVTR